MSLNTTANARSDGLIDPNLARGPMKSLHQPVAAGTVRVEVPVRQRGDLWIPCAESNRLMTAKFRCMTTGDYVGIERETTEMLVDRRNRLALDLDIIAMRALMLRRMLLQWNLNVPLEFDAKNWLTDDCWQRVQQLPGALMSALVDRYERSFTVGEDEMRVINRQSVVLFGKNSSGVAKPCEAVSLFCNLNSFWKHFGMDRRDLDELPYLDYVRLRTMVANENESMARQLRSQEHSTPKANIIGRGGKSRPSRGIVVPNPSG